MGELTDTEKALCDHFGPYAILYVLRYLLDQVNALRSSAGQPAITIEEAITEIQQRIASAPMPQGVPNELF